MQQPQCMAPVTDNRRLVRVVMAKSSIMPTTAFWCRPHRVAITGYWAYGNIVASNVLFSLQHLRGVISLASATVLDHVRASWQVYTVSPHPAARTLCYSYG